MFRWLSLPALVLLGMLSFAPDAQAASGYTTGNVNMRTGPSTRYARILTIPRGAGVAIYGCSGSWCDTYYAGRRGWVSARYLSTGYHYRSVSPGAAAAGIIGLGIGAIIAESLDDRRHYRSHRRVPRYYYRGHYPRRVYRHRPRPRFVHPGVRRPALRRHWHRRY